MRKCQKEMVYQTEPMLPTTPVTLVEFISHNNKGNIILVSSSACEYSSVKIFCQPHLDWHHCSWNPFDASQIQNFLRATFLIVINAYGTRFFFATRRAGLCCINAFRTTTWNDLSLCLCSLRRTCLNQLDQAFCECIAPSFKTFFNWTLLVFSSKRCAYKGH